MKKQRLIKKYIIFIMSFLMACSLTGCSFWQAIDKGLKENKRKMDDKYWTERNVPPVDLDINVICPGEEINFDHDIRVSRCVYKYLEEGDKKSLKKMFAESVIDDYDNLESDLDELIDFYAELDIDEFEVTSNSMYGAHKLDPHDTITEYKYRTRFECEGDSYELDILYLEESIKDEKLIGVHGIKIRNRDTNESVVVNRIEEDIY